MSTKHRSQAGPGDRSRRQEAARRARAEAEAQARRRRSVWWVAGAVAVVVVALVVGLLLSGGSPKPNRAKAVPVATGASQPTVGIALSTSAPPWPIPSNAAVFIGAAGLNVRASETLQVHYHAHVDITENGTAVTVPPYIGYLIDKGRATGLTAIHTHDASGIVHIESPTDVPYTLGQVFTEWGVRLTFGQVGGLVSGHGNVLRVYVNGTAFRGDPATIILRPHEEIAFWYGSAATSPRVPSGYAFPAGD